MLDHNNQIHFSCMVTNNSKWSACCWGVLGYGTRALVVATMYICDGPDHLGDTQVLGSITWIRAI